MTYFIKINDDLLIDTDSICALGVDDGEGFVALQGNHRFTMSVDRVEQLRVYMSSRRGAPVFDLDGSQIIHSFSDEDK